MDNQQQISKITIDGVEYEVDKLSQKTRSLLVVHQDWSAELRTQRLDVAKTEAALRDLSREIITAVKSDSDTKVDQSPTIEL